MGRVSSYNRAITIKKSRHRLERDHGSVHKEPEVSASSVSLSLSSLSLDLREMLVFVEINKRERERVFAVLVVAKNDVRSFFSAATAVVPRPIMAGGGRIERSRGARNGRLAE